MNKKALLLAAAIVAAVPAWAEWEPVGQTSDGQSVYYMDLSSIRVIGSMRRAWVLMSMETPSKSGVMSYRVFEEFDCSEGSSRILQLQGYKGAMGTGEATGSGSGVEKWVYHAPDTVGLRMTRAACGERPRK